MIEIRLELQGACRLCLRLYCVNVTPSKHESIGTVSEPLLSHLLFAAGDAKADRVQGSGT